MIYRLEMRWLADVGILDNYHFVSIADGHIWCKHKDDGKDAGHNLWTERMRKTIKLEEVLEKKWRKEHTSMTIHANNTFVILKIQWIIIASIFILTNWVNRTEKWLEIWNCYKTWIICSSFGELFDAS